MLCLSNKHSIFSMSMSPHFINYDDLTVNIKIKINLFILSAKIYDKKIIIYFYLFL